MKNLICFLLTLIIYSTNAQNPNLIGFVSYRQTTNNNNEIIERNYDLSFNRIESYYEEEVIVDLEKGQINKDDGTVLIKTRDTKLPQYYYNKLDKGFYFNEIFYNTHLFVNDVFKLNWKLVNEIKKINNFLCSKATVNFRGRDYTVWFTDEINTPFGPWKLSGLPGLILEVYDATGFFKITATKIEINTPLIKNFKIPKIKTLEAISIEEHFKKRHELENMFIEKINSQLPKGMIPIKIDKNCKDCGIELENYNAKN
jgi:GLPGLI family protein